MISAYEAINILVGSLNKVINGTVDNFSFFGKEAKIQLPTCRKSKNHERAGVVSPRPWHYIAKTSPLLPGRSASLALTSVC